MINELRKNSNADVLNIMESEKLAEIKPVKKHHHHSKSHSHAHSRSSKKKKKEKEPKILTEK